MEAIGTEIKGTDISIGGPVTAGVVRRLAAYHLQCEELFAAAGRPTMAREARRRYEECLTAYKCSGPMCGRYIIGTEEARFRHPDGKAFCSRNCMESHYDGITKGRVRSAALV